MIGSLVAWSGCLGLGCSTATVMRGPESEKWVGRELRIYISREFSSILLVYWKFEVLSEIVAFTSSVVSDG